MPSTKEKKLNIFQRPFRGIANFRKKRPYWFAFIVGTVVGLLLAGAVTTMIFAPHLTPAFLMGAKLFVAKMGLTAVISTFAGGGVGAGIFLGALFAGAKRLFDGFRSCFHKPLLKKTVIENLLSSSGKITRRLKGSHPAHSFTVVPDPLPSGVAQPSSLTGSRPASDSPQSNLLFFPSIDETVRKEKEKQQQTRADQARQCFEEASAKYDDTKEEIIADFKKAIGLAIAIPQGGHDRARSHAIEEIKRETRLFMRGELLEINLSNIFLDEIPGEIHAEVELVKERLKAAQAKMASPAYQDCHQRLKEIEKIRNEAKGQTDNAAKLRGQLGSIYKNDDAYRVKLREIKEDREKKIARVYERFFDEVEKANDEAARQKKGRRFK